MKIRLQIGHVVTQVLALFRQPLDRPVFRRRHAKCRTRDLRRQDSEIPLFPNAALFPFIRQVLPYGDAPQPFVDPILRITFGLVNGLHAFLRQAQGSRSPAHAHIRPVPAIA